LKDSPPLAQRLFQNEAPGIHAELSAASNTLLIAFSGIFGGFGGMPVFEFSRTLEKFAVKKFFVRDLAQAWYQRGLPEAGGTIDEVSEYLQGSIRQLNVQRIVTLGNSMGGYAALLFGWLLQVDEAHAFSPQTYIDRKRRLLTRDSRWKDQIDQIYQVGEFDRRYLDLRALFQSRSVRTTFHLYYCHSNRLDRHHATRMRKFPNVVLHRHNAGGHVLVKWLRDIGSLDTLLAECVRENIG
jgi:hypothetical protein